MMTIWKFALAPLVEMPVGAKILSVQFQGGRPVMWALVDPTAPKAARAFAVYGTGGPVPADAGTFLLTIQNGPEVSHLFEVAVKAATVAVETSPTAN